MKNFKFPCSARSRRDKKQVASIPVAKLFESEVGFQNKIRKIK